ncbi:MAG TPA: hypothetical protein PKM10_07775 [Halanaerobiales bacterium]|nr:hypothetical protein [Halanaerobiales bacterium]
MRKRLLVYIVLPLIIIFFLSGCRYFFGGNYPRLTFESMDIVSGKYNEENKEYEYSISGTALNHGAPGEFRVLIFDYVGVGRWRNIINYGPIYIDDKADFDVSWSTKIPYGEKVRVDFYVIRIDGEMKKVHTVEF